MTTKKYEPSEFGVGFGGDLKEVRESRLINGKPMTLRQASSRARISATGLLRIEKGVRDNPKLSTLMEIAEALNVKLVITSNSVEVIDLGDIE